MCFALKQLVSVAAAADADTGGKPEGEDEEEEAAELVLVILAGFQTLLDTVMEGDLSFELQKRLCDTLIQDAYPLVDDLLVIRLQFRFASSC